MQDIDFIAEARARNVEPVIFYIADRHRRLLRRGAAAARAASPVARSSRSTIRSRRAARAHPQEQAYQSFLAHELRLTIPILDPASRHALTDPQFSLSDFMRQPIALGEATLQPDAIRSTCAPRSAPG